MDPITQPQLDKLTAVLRDPLGIGLGDLGELLGLHRVTAGRLVHVKSTAVQLWLLWLWRDYEAGAWPPPSLLKLLELNGRFAVLPERAPAAWGSP